MVNRFALGGVLAAAALPGCSLIFDTDNLPVHDAPPPDTAQPDANPFDADPSMLMVTGVEPTSIYEGEGSVAGSPPAVIVVSGSSIISPTIELAWSDGVTPAPELVESMHQGDAKQVAIALRVPERLDIDAGDNSISIVVTLMQPGATPASVNVTMTALDELAVAATTTLQVADLDERFSSITLNANTFFAGTAPVRLIATGPITIAAGVMVSASGNGSTAGPHGCDGGLAENPGGCGVSGGGTGEGGGLLGLAAGGGGGGGGFASPGTAGGANGQAAGGTPGGVFPAGGSAIDMLVPLSSQPGVAGNRGHGGGGGGAGLTTTGRAGGGGGGVVELRGGGITVGAGAQLVANGAPGVTSAGTGAGGGGGSGGTILVRSSTPISSTGAWLIADGGAGGAGGGGAPAGGRGGIGRVRIDQPESVVGMATTPTAIAGPMWDPAVATVITTAPTYTFRGEPGRSYQVYIDRTNDPFPPVDVPTPSGVGTVAPVGILPGLNRICVAYGTIAEATNLAPDEAKNCFTVAFMRP